MWGNQQIKGTVSVIKVTLYAKMAAMPDSQRYP